MIFDVVCLADEDVRFVLILDEDSSDNRRP
jgi:hypothetical protein